MDRAKANELIKEAEMAFAEIAKKHGLAVGRARGSFTNSSVKLSIELAEVGTGGVALDREAIELQKFADMYGLPKNAFGMEFTEAGHKYKLVGLAARRSRFPVIGEREDGKRYKFSIDHVKALLGAKL